MTASFANRRWDGPARTVTVVVCVLLLALVSLAQVSHLHPTAAGADQCTLCLVMHSVVPVAVTAVAIVLVQLGVSAPAAVVQVPLRRRPSELFTRPPPRA